MVKIADIKKTMEKQSKSASDKLFLLKSGEKAKIRVRLELDDINEVPIWSRYDESDTSRNVQIISPTVVGQKDEFSEHPENFDLGDIKRIVYYPLPVWNYEKEMTQIWLLKGTTQSPLNQLIAQITDAEVDLCEQDLVVSREGERFETKYNIAFRKSSEFVPTKGGKKVKAKPISWDMVTKKLFEVFPAPNLDEYRVGGSDENITTGEEDDF